MKIIANECLSEVSTIPAIMRKILRHKFSGVGKLILAALFSAVSLTPVNSFSAVSLTPPINFKLFGYL